MKGVIVKKTLFLLVMGLAGALSLYASETQANLDNRIRKLTAKFDSMQQQSDKRVPADVLRKAQGIILLDRTKAGFISPTRAAMAWRW